MFYRAAGSRYAAMTYNYCGNSGLRLPAVSLGIWQNFGADADDAVCRDILRTAFDHGITYFDAANNYGPPPGSAEERFGRILREDFRAYRDQMVIATKAGYTMWEGPYGDWGSKKYLTASLDASLRRLGLEYVDIFYHHRPDGNTPSEEVAHTLAQIVRQGKALYVGVSNYSAEQTAEIYALLREERVPFIVHQGRYNLLDRRVEAGENSLCDVLDEKGVGFVAFSPLAQGVLTEKYFDGVPSDSRRARCATIPETVFNETNLDKAMRLSVIAHDRGQTLAETALAWVLHNPVVTSVLIGARNTEQLLQNLRALDNVDFSATELEKIDEILRL